MNSLGFFSFYFPIFAKFSLIEHNYFYNESEFTLTNVCRTAKEYIGWRERREGGLGSAY